MLVSNFKLISVFVALQIFSFPLYVSKIYIDICQVL
jgi:hypothetical protein